MCLIGSFVGRETQVAVYAIGAVFHGKAFARGIESRDAIYELLCNLVGTCLCAFVKVFVCHKPFTVVVAKHEQILARNKITVR